MRRKYGLSLGTEPQVVDRSAGKTVPPLKVYRDHLKANPDAAPTVLFFHEDAISGDHLSRVPDLMVDWLPYEMTAEERKTFDEQFAAAVAAGKEFRANAPQVKISLGNATVPFCEEFWRHKFPRELFDYCGNESPTFGRPPEAQPPDPIANNASIWMDRVILDHHGYHDKPIQQCYEACYVNTNPGNVSLSDQSDYYVRHFLHGLAWNIPSIRYGILADVGNSYYYSNWGASGFLNRFPEMNPKPSYVAVANMTRVLDGARFVRDVPVPSPSVYVLEFDRPDGCKVWALWTLRGKRPATLRLAHGENLVLFNDQGRTSRPIVKERRLEVTLTPSVVYLVGGGMVESVQLSKPEYDEKPEGKRSYLSPLANMDEWMIEPGHDPILEFYSMMTPRRKGDFEFAHASDIEGFKGGAIRITPRPIKNGKDTMPMYVALAHKKGIALPGQPTEIGLWINGNSGWGRVIFELEDASGQKWTSIGAPQAEDPPRWLARVVAEPMRARFKPWKVSDWNTEDIWGISRINFDGWRYVSFPLPGQYPGEGYGWPADCMWRYDKDGAVHYPLTLERLVVEFPEKVLHVKTWAPAPRREIYLKDLIATENEVNSPKQTPIE